MYKSWIFVFLLTLTSGISGCVGVSQTFETPTLVPSVIPAPITLPTRIQLPQPTLAQSPVPTTTRQAQPTAGSGTRVIDQTLEKLINQARKDVSQRAQVADNAIQVKSTQPVEWPDSALGCPQPGKFYSQIVTAGYLIVLEANGKDYEYHTNLTQAIYCAK